MSLGVSGRMWRHAGGVNDPPGAAMISDFIDLACGKTSVHEDWPSIEAGQGQQNSDERPGVLAHNHDPIPRTHTGIKKPSLGLGNHGTQLSIGPSAAGFDKGGAIRRKLHPGLHDVAGFFWESPQEVRDLI